MTSIKPSIEQLSHQKGKNEVTVGARRPLLSLANVSEYARVTWRDGQQLTSADVHLRYQGTVQSLSRRVLL